MQLYQCNCKPRSDDFISCVSSLFALIIINHQCISYIGREVWEWQPSLDSLPMILLVISPFPQTRTNRHSQWYFFFSLNLGGQDKWGKFSSIFKGSHQMPWIATLFEDENPKFLKAHHAGCSLSHDPTVLHFTAYDQSSNETSIELFPAIYTIFARLARVQFFFMLNSLWCTDQSSDALLWYQI